MSDCGGMCHYDDGCEYCDQMNEDARENAAVDRYLDSLNEIDEAKAWGGIDLPW